MRQRKFRSVRSALSGLRRVNITRGRVAAATAAAAVLGGGAYALHVSRRDKVEASASE